MSRIERPQWRLRTKSTLYCLRMLPDSSGLVLDHWGEPTEVPPWPDTEPAPVFALPADVLPLEYASNGQRAVSFSELLVDRGAGNTGAIWTVLPNEVRWTSEATGDLLVVPLRDETGDLRLELTYSTSQKHDVIRRRAALRNDGASPVELRRAFSAAWNLPLGQHVRVDYLAGAWAREFQPRSVELDWGTFSVGSRQGVTGLHFSPVVTVTATPEPDFGPPDGRGYGIALAWSGSWRLQVENAAVGKHARVSCGLDEDTTVITLPPDGTFTSPDSLGLFSPDGPEGVTRGWHDFQRAELTRDTSPAARPVVYNSWYATEFDVRVDHQRQLADIAADIGAEVFVVDDGWFAGRTSDRAGLGDWRTDPEKFPHGLGELAGHVLQKGMRFGLWVEPECVNPNSDLFRRHPDWIYHSADRPAKTIRNQYVLDLGREEVVTWVEDTIRKVLSSVPITYLKWDMNRPISDGGRSGDPRGREWSLQHTRNYYRVLETIRREFPHVTVEACASGGGRIDNAVLERSDIVWTSDNVGPLDRLVIQDGFLHAYPSWVMSSWVSDDPGHRDRRQTSLGYRFAVAMSGVLGIGGDLLAWSDSDRKAAAKMVAIYKDIRTVVLYGESTLHGAPEDGLYCIEFTGPDSDPRTVLFVYDRDHARGKQPRVFPKALRLDIAYRVNDSDEIVTAASPGVAVPFVLAPDADVLVLTPVPH